MLIPQQAHSRFSGRQGCLSVEQAELRRRLSSPSTVRDERRQRLLEFVDQPVRVQELGDEYARVKSLHLVLAGPTAGQAKPAGSG